MIRENVDLTFCIPLGWGGFLSRVIVWFVYGKGYTYFFLIKNEAPGFLLSFLRIDPKCTSEVS